MHTTKRMEAHILDTANILLVPSSGVDGGLSNDFCGTVVNLSDTGSLPCFSGKTLYLCGHISQAMSLNLNAAERILVIKELSYGYDDQQISEGWSLVDAGRVPQVIHGVGVYYRRFFAPQFDYFNRICTEHVFQALTESNKQGKAHRTGIYLTPVEQSGEDLHFRLLRCSTNLSGPTENFRATDRHIVEALNQEAEFIFKDHAAMNHVLAQIYHNTPAVATQKQSKATISAHADKTKDMPATGIMAFCTFYDRLDKLHPLANDVYDYGYKNTSALTRLRFRLKEPGEHCDLPSQFTITLYPNSVFFMPLSTNRLYTHEIQPSPLPGELLPTRLGYVVRCSSAEAVHKNGHTFLKNGRELVQLEQPTEEGMQELRKLYAEENRTRAFIDYGHKFHFSMNEGDYVAPQYKATDEFRTYTPCMEGNPFEELFQSIRFEDVGKGRRGAVLVRVDEVGRTPVVRTTTSYNNPAYRFRAIHERLARQIRDCASLSISFNNALIETYSNAYSTMGAHSDQSLDLAAGSFIAIYSCYEHPDRASQSPRKLLVESKDSRGDRFEIPLNHNSVVVFSLDTNRRFKHKIVLDDPCKAAPNQWMGLTFRTSKTLVEFRDEQACFLDGTALSLASEEQSREFFQMRGQENSSKDFSYPDIAYTISRSDLMPPE